MTYATRSQESRTSYAVRRDVTLNGHPASISGLKNPFATVAARDGSGLRAEFSWEAVARVCGKDAAFKV